MTASPTDPANPPDATDAPDATGTTPPRAEAFVAGLPEPSDPTRRDATWARIGLVLMVLGALVALVAVVLSQGSDNTLDQSTQLTMAVAGVAVTTLGAAVFLRYSLGRLLRFWLLRILDESHRDGR